MAFCTKCGTPSQTNAAFCGNCGTQVAVTPATQFKDASQAIPAEASTASSTNNEMPLALPTEPKARLAYQGPGTQKSESPQNSDSPHTNESLVSFAKFISSWKVRVAAIALTLVGIGIHYAYTQHQRQALIQTVRNSHVPDFSITMGQFLESKFQNYNWSTYRNPDKSITVAFTGYQTFQDAMGGPGNPDMVKCLERDACSPIIKKISDSCVPPGDNQQGDPSPEQIRCVHDGIANNANTLIPVNFLFAVDEHDASVSLRKTDLVPEKSH